jgi:maltose alpha-D-glucosyltransferase / alpha-amylase
VYGDRLILKLFRCLDAGVNPELEIGRFLTKRNFPHTPRVVGALEYRDGQEVPTRLAVLQAYVPNQGEAWEYAQTELRAFFDRVSDEPADRADAPITAAALLALSSQVPPAAARRMIGPFLDLARRIGQRTAELHLALSDGLDDAGFAPHPITTLYQRSIYQSLRSLTGLVFGDLRRRLHGLPEAVQANAQAMLDLEPAILKRCQAVTADKIEAVRIRCHGDYHLGQLLLTGDDVVIFDFEGEPQRPVLERQLKRPAFDDVASMLRSLHHATYDARLGRAEDQGDSWAAITALDQWACYWTRWTSAAFLAGYLAAAGSAAFVPQALKAQIVLLDVLLLERAIHVLGYELRNRPERMRDALDGLRLVLGQQADR